MPSAARSHKPTFLRTALCLLIPTAAAAARWYGGPGPAALPALVTAPGLVRAAAPLAPAVAVLPAPALPPVTPLLAPAPVAPAPAVAAAATVAAPARITLEPLASPEQVVNLVNVNTGERASFRIGTRGYVRTEEVAAVDRFFRCRRTERQRAIDPGVLVLLADIGRHWPGREIEIISGFRAPPFGAPHSRHFTGHAIDLRVRGVRTAAVRDYVWREHQGVGVGHYADEDFVHVDSRPEAKEIAWSAREEDSTPQYNPRWAKRIRRSALARPSRDQSDQAQQQHGG
jgi:uncharacterized protein YcbK (DUF882 family)